MYSTGVRTRVLDDEGATEPRVRGAPNPAGGDQKTEAGEREEDAGGGDGARSTLAEDRAPDRRTSKRRCRYGKPFVAKTADEKYSQRLREKPLI